MSFENLYCTPIDPCTRSFMHTELYKQSCKQIKAIPFDFVRVCVTKVNTSLKFLALCSSVILKAIKFGIFLSVG